MELVAFGRVSFGEESRPDADFTNEGKGERDIQTDNIDWVTDTQVVSSGEKKYRGNFFLPFFLLFIDFCFSSFFRFLPPFRKNYRKLKMRR